MYGAGLGVLGALQKEESSVLSKILDKLGGIQEWAGRGRCQGQNQGRDIKG
jgi:hypothetical protein